MLHEAGHVFGLDENAADAGSAMNPAYGYHTQLAAADIAGLQALYGARQADAQNNGTLANATLIGTSKDGGTTAGDISALQDVDYYKIQTPGGLLSGFNAFTVQLKTSGISLLVPSLAAYEFY